MSGISSLREDVNVEVLWNELKGCYRALLLKAIALRREGEWINVMLTGFLTHERVKTIRKIVEDEYNSLVELGVTKLSDLLVVYDVLNAMKLPEFIDKLQEGYVTISNECIRLRDPRPPVSIRKHLRFEYLELYEYPGVCIELESRTTPQSIRGLRAVEEELKSLGYSQFDELCVQWLGMECGLSLEATIALPIYLAEPSIRLDESTGEVVFRAKIHEALLPKLELIMALTEERKNVQVPMENVVKTFNELATHKHSENFIVVEYRHKFRRDLKPENIVRCRIVSNLGILESTAVAVSKLLPKPTGLQKLFIEFVDLDTLWKILRREENVGEHVGRRPELSFQRGVAWLFTLLGFRVIELEGTRYKMFREANGSVREVDVILYDEESGKMLITDCTIRAPEPRKVDDIANTKVSLMRKGIYTEPLIIVGDLASETKRNIRGVKVLDVEDLEKIINYLKRGEVDKARKILLKLS